MTNEEIMIEAIFKSKLFDSNTCSFFDCIKSIETTAKNIEFQLAQFSVLTWPGAGVIGFPFKAGKFFTNKMKSGKIGVWLCVKEIHDRDEEAGEILAYFVGYKGETRFYGAKELEFLMGYWKKINFNWDNNHYKNGTHL